MQENDPDSIHRINSAINSAIERSQQLDRPLILSIDLPCPPANSVCPYGSFHWHQKDRHIVAGGSVLKLIAEPTHDRFLDIKNQTKYWLANCLGEPILVGGFSFYDSPQNDIPPALFILPEWTYKEQKGTAKLSHNFIIHPSTDQRSISQKLSQPIPQITISKSPPLIKSINEKLGELSWAIAVEKARTLMGTNQLEKLVLARFLEISAQDRIDPYLPLQNLREYYPECTSFLFELLPDQHFLGASPELLLQSKFAGDRLELNSLALAGTIGRGYTQELDRQLAQQLATSPKNLREHQIVVRSIRHSLAHLHAQISPTHPPQILSLPNVQHLSTPIHAQLATSDPFTFFDVLAKLHPTAAMSGAPRPQAIALMRSLEPCDRSWYAAPIGWFDSQGNCEFFVGIRSGHLQGHQALLFAGSGILPESDLTQEEQETNAKFKPMLNALGIPSLEL